jgi:GNAT superfamily N-acetyltransferase
MALLQIQFLLLPLYFLLTIINGLVHPSGKASIYKTNKNINKSSSIQVHPIATPKDKLDLADLRFQEWMQDSNDGGIAPSRYAFRMATAEITDERGQEGAISFLAKMTASPTNGETVIVGSAELSPIELKGTLPSSLATTKISWLYVTDVVTSSDHRRLGVGTALMDAIEEHASKNMSCTRIYLHVCPGNGGALRFYATRGYSQVPNNAELDTDRLAEAAGTQGQLLLFKELLSSRPSKQSHKKEKRGKGGKGFG